MKKKKLRKCLRIAVCACATALSLYLWTTAAEYNAHVEPEYPREDISSYINRETLQPEDYELLFQQTGLGAAAVDTLRMEGRQEELLTLQERYFAKVNIACNSNTILSRAEYLVDVESGQTIPVVEEGDILINFNCHFFGWRSGHAGIVTDAQHRQTLEARILGTDTALLRLDQWQEYPSFAVLRLKDASREERREIAAYAAENLTDIPYRLTAGMWETHIPGEEVVSGTQCAHLVWIAYRHFGYDLDSDGGLIVTPRDIFESPLLEIVQVYGIKINEKP